MKRIALIAAIGLSAGSAAAAEFWPTDAKLYLIEPANGATIKGKVTVKFGLKGLGVAPAGTAAPKTGHHHILIDTAAPTGADLEGPIPADGTHRHFGGGQTETVLDLPPGKHTLQLIMGDQNHVPHDPPLVSETVSITVE